MGQGGARQREKQENRDEGQSGAEDEPLRGLDYADFSFKSCNDRNYGQNEIHGVVVEKLARDFGSQGGKVELPEQTNAVAMESKTDEMVLNIPIKNRDTTNGGD